MRVLETNNCLDALFDALKYFKTHLHFINDGYIIDFCAENYPLVFFNINPI